MILIESLNWTLKTWELRRRLLVGDFNRWRRPSFSLRRCSWFLRKWFRCIWWRLNDDRFRSFHFVYGTYWNYFRDSLNIFYFKKLLFSIDQAWGLFCCIHQNVSCIHRYSWDLLSCKENIPFHLFHMFLPKNRNNLKIIRIWFKKMF